MSVTQPELTQRERELGAIIAAYNDVTEQLKSSHERLRDEVARLRGELERKNRQLRRRERLAALGELAAGVAHEIRNPLGGIRLFASLLEKDLADRPESQRLAGKIIKGAVNLETIVTDILEFARPAEPHAGAVRLDRLVRETVELAWARAEQRGAKLEIVESGEGIEIVTDGGLLQRAMLNLLHNGVDAAAGEGRGPGPLVQIAVRCAAQDRVVLVVTDNGPGIPSEHLDRIFNPFFTTKATGTGLGLAIVHQIVEVLGGSIQAANRREGGAVFSLSLPAKLDKAAGP